MSRFFNNPAGTNTAFITLAAGGMANVDGGPLTLAVIWKPASVRAGGLFRADNGSGTAVMVANPYSDGLIYWSVSGFRDDTAVGGYNATDGWYLWAVTKADGTATPRFHRYRYDTATWAHGNGAGTINDSAAGPITSILIGKYDADEFAHGYLAVMGGYATSYSDAALEASGFTTSLKAWRDGTSPIAIWSFGQSSTSEPVADLTGGGADQTAITGTSVSSDDPPGFRYSTTRRRRLATYIRGTEGRLNDVLTTLGATKTSMWPFWEATGTLVAGISVGDLTASETAAAAEQLEDDFAPALLPCGLYSYHFHPTGDHHLAGIDHANYSFGDGSVDSPFSVGAWIRPNAVATNVVVAKYDSAGNLEEWRLFIDSNGKLSLELHDASASATEIAVSDDALTIGQWVFAVATYDGGETAPVVTLYINGAAVNDGSTTETGTYTAMENTAAPLTVGCSGVTATPVAEFHGRIAMPWITGKALTAAEVETLYGYTAPMVGIN